MFSKYQQLVLESETQIFNIYSQLLRIRKIEEVIAERYTEWEMRCPVHLSIGQEAIPVGVSMHLSIEDHVYSNHRSHGHYFAKGGNLKKMIAELYGKETGCCGGRGGSMHLIDLDVGFMGSTPIVGGTVPLAVGDAWSSVLKGEKRVSVIYFGDGCFEEGVIHESMNFATLHKLPVLFVCENNGYSVYTKLNDRQSSREIIDIANAHGIQTHNADGNDVLDVMEASYNAIEGVKNGEGPQFLEFSTYRWLEHCGPFDDDNLNYRPQGELSTWKAKCPVEKIKKHISKKYINCERQFKLIEKEIYLEIDQAFEFAINSKSPSTDTLDKHIYA
jgi:TPP-dependent pyruvate/acetoin dehydrogenase alpha subunit